MGRLDDAAAWSGLSAFVAKSASAQVEVGDDRDGLQRCGNDLVITVQSYVATRTGKSVKSEMCKTLQFPTKYVHSSLARTIKSHVIF